MNSQYDFQRFKNKLNCMSINDLAKELDENNKLGKLFLKKEKDLTEEEKEILQKEIERSDNADYIPFEEAMEELYKYAEELRNERIQNKARFNYSR